ncbi:hypothetical protein GMES_0758 [Paraglaciecola mesophila KMM 241]|uniref:Uncharacterized protein n=1 Tax=Paraglaciecola mesophila KMM 241 TaxID=1128912 RepID=K6Z246_9ALTE|nr:hypothetical protein GMES_0758 [Paraglaciecola mesophila KMM 241]
MRQIAFVSPALRCTRALKLMLLWLNTDAGSIITALSLKGFLSASSKTFYKHSIKR